jgi:hypothetical protein
MRMRITGLNDLIVEGFQFSAPSMQPPCAVDRARVRYLERHLEVSLNLLTIIDILNESPNRVLQYLRTHFNL